MIDQNIIYEDNQGAITLTKNPEYHVRKKHIDIQYHFIQVCIKKDKIILKYCETAKMITDMLIKSLSKQRHQELIEKMGLYHLSKILCHHQSETSDLIAQEMRVLNYSEQFKNYSQS